MRRFTYTLCAVSMLGFGNAVMAGPRGGEGILHLDADGDGRVSQAEFNPPESRRGRGGLERADTDGDGAVSRQEMLDALAEASEEHQQRMIEIFDRTDADGNGVVTREELTAQMFARIDGDGDGFVTQDEARAARAAMRDKFGGRERRGRGDGRERGNGDSES